MHRRMLTPLLLIVQALSAQSPEAVASWIHLDAVPGTERETAATLSAELPGWRTDRWGNLTKTVGRDAPHRVVACALDYSAFVVSQITDDGYLRLRRTGAPSHPLWNQYQEAQRVAIRTRAGRVPGVVAVFNGHFARQHVADSLASTADNLWVDIGARSRAEVEQRGIALLDPVFPDRPQWSFGAYASGPAAGLRAGCAAVAAAARGTPTTGTTTFVISTQRVFGWLGLSTVLAGMPAATAVAIVDAGDQKRSARVLQCTRLPAAYRALATGSLNANLGVFSPAVRWGGTTVETIDSTEIAAVAAWVASAAGLDAPVAPLRLATDTSRRLAPRTDAYGALENRFFQLADLPGVSKHEGRVRDAVMAALPAWAKARATVDSAGNVVVAAGPDRAPMAILAHLDEVGFEVARVLPNGEAELRSMGGAVLPSWESVPALLHFDVAGKAPLRGVFLPRDEGMTRVPRAPLRAWFGLDTAALRSAGVAAGASVTAYKRAERLSGTRITGRSSDDRTGSTALLAAVQRLDPAKLTRRVYFVWTVEEETGLSGAAAFGAKYGRTLERVYSVDTFVSSDTPLESPHFAFAPLGAGAVLRGVDDGTVAVRSERERVVAIAARAGIPLQVGTTQGSTDGSAISPSGPPNLGLSWPGRYSHGPGEILDLKDLHALTRLVVAVALAP
ncbi:MAG: M20/M25/M40 family metallo-hydrolase [Gemmatimonadaceae bacterium]|nr:M20/M25/M40 family metallo-hydrolase [Gemmatimonadaceae bacterium]